MTATITHNNATAGEFVSMLVAGQEVAIPVQVVQDILASQRLTKVPMAPPEVSGVLNLRGRIVTAIDLRKRLRAVEGDERQGTVSVVIEHQDELYSLIVDKIGAVLKPPPERYVEDTKSLSAAWRGYASGIYRLEDKLLVVLDVDKLLDFGC